MLSMQHSNRHCKTGIRRIFLVCSWLMLFGCGAWPVTAQNARDMAPTVRAGEFVGHILAVRDPDGTLTPETVLDRVRKANAMRVVSRTPDFGFTKDTIWLYLPLVNQTETSDWYLRIRENFFQEFTVWHVSQAGLLEQVVFQDEQSNFATRPVQWPELVVRFNQPPGQTGAVLIRYRSGGSTELGMTLFDVPNFEAWADRKTAQNFIYYGMLLFLIAASTATCLVTRQGIFLAYAFYATSGLLFLMHADGNAFRFLWPEAPAFNAFATVPLGTAVIVFGANFARQFLQTHKHHPVFDKLLLGAISVTLVTTFSSIYADTQMIKKLLVLFAFCSTVLFLASGINAARTRMREVRFFVIAWTGAVLSSAIMTGRHWIGLEISEEMQFNSMRIVFVLDAALMGLAILDRFNTLRRSKAEALETSLLQAQSNLALSQRMQTLEQRYSRAVDMAQNREQRIAEAIHDLRQPLHALRMNVQSLLDDGTRNRSDEQYRDIDQTFQFLEGLVTEELDAHAEPLSIDAEVTQTVDLGMCLGSIHKMFGPEAKEKGVVLRVDCTSRNLRLPAGSLMRILTNLVSNAVRYTPAGRIDVTVQETDCGGLRIEVQDTGPGLSAEEFEVAIARGARLETSKDQDGHGLGLAIVCKTCSALGLGFDRTSKAERGTALSVSLKPEHLA